MAVTLSRRERQILNALYRHRSATVAEVQEALEDPPGYDGVRTTLRVLERKGYIGHRQDGPRYLYFPVESLETARRNALRHVVGTFFDGSAAQAAQALLSMSDAELSDRELDGLRALVERKEES